MFTSSEFTLSSHFRVQKRNTQTGAITNIGADDLVCGIDFLHFSVSLFNSLKVIINNCYLLDVQKLSINHSRSGYT